MSDTDSMPEEIWAGMLKEGSTYWCSHKIEANLYGAKHAKGMSDTKYIRSPQWQPIETAPKDGTLIIGWTPVWVQPIVCGCNRRGFYVHPDHESYVVLEKWQPFPQPPEEK